MSDDECVGGVGGTPRSECEDEPFDSDDEPDDVASNHSDDKDENDVVASSSDEADDDADTIGSSEIYSHEQLANKRKKKNEPNITPLSEHKAVEQLSAINDNVAQSFLMYDTLNDAYDDLSFLLHGKTTPPNAFKERLETELKKHKTTLDVVDGVEQCRKCQSKKLYTCQMQTRSGDESMTTFYVCSQCAAKWKT